MTGSAVDTSRLAEREATLHPNDPVSIEYERLASGELRSTRTTPALWRASSARPGAAAAALGNRAARGKGMSTTPRFTTRRGLRSLRGSRRLIPALALVLAVAVAIAAVLGAINAAAAPVKSPLSVTVSPTSAIAGTSGNSFAFKVVASDSVAGQLSLQVPAGWSAPQASNSTLPGYIVIQKLTCATAGPFPASIAGSGPWTIVINFNCAAKKNFSITYGGVTGTNMVTAPPSSGAYEFTAEADTGSGFQRLATQPVIFVNPAPVHLVVTGLPNPSAVGSANTFTVTAMNSSNNVVKSYAGAVHFTSTDPAATLPADYAFTTADNGSHTFTGGATFVTMGSRALSATDISNAAITGSQTVSVNAGPATTFVVSGLPNPVTAGNASTFTVTAKDAFSNTATGYTGTVHFTSSDGASILPADYTFMAGDAGVHTFTNAVTLKTPGPRSVTATDTANMSITGLQSVTVNAGAVSQLVVAGLADPSSAGVAQSVTVTAKDASTIPRPATRARSISRPRTGRRSCRPTTRSRPVTPGCTRSRTL